MELNISQVTGQVEELDRQLMELREGLFKLEALAQRAVAPVTMKTVPKLNAMMKGLQGFAQHTSQVISGMFAHLDQEVGKSVRGVKRALADFDQLDRLSFGSATYKKTLADALKSLQSLDLSQPIGAFEGLRQAIAPFGRTLFTGLEWAWNALLLPLSGWGADQMILYFLGQLQGAFRSLGTELSTRKPMLSWLWQGLLQPMGQWSGAGLVATLENLGGGLNTLSDTQPGLLALTEKLRALDGGFRDLSGNMTGFGRLAQSLGGITDTLKGKLEGLVQGLPASFSAAAEGAMAVVNTAVSGMENAINAVVGSLNSFKLEIPSWVPVLGGKKFAMNFGTVDFPPIPQLARGAVLPANKPFLAVVGDQPSGTNIEAPLATIQQAVAQVMGQGSQDTNRLLAQILTAIGSIEVGDETIGRAARRYESRMALMGGAL